MVNTDIKFQIHKKSYDKRPEIRMKIKNSNRNKEKAKSKKAKQYGDLPPSKRLQRH